VRVTGAFSFITARIRPFQADDIASSPEARSWGGWAPAVHHTLTCGFSSVRRSRASFTFSSVRGYTSVRLTPAPSIAAS
jgi:hypothetical protein